MNLVFVVQEKNISVVVVPYKKIIIDIKAINTNTDTDIKAFLDFKIWFKLLSIGFKEYISENEFKKSIRFEKSLFFLTWHK